MTKLFRKEGRKEKFLSFQGEKNLPTFKARWDKLLNFKSKGAYTPLFYSFHCSSSFEVCPARNSSNSLFVVNIREKFCVVITICFIQRLSERLKMVSRNWL